MNTLYKIAGVSKQAVHKHNQYEQWFEQKLYELVLEADVLRSEHPGCGVEKMYYTLKPDWIGRDRFVEIFMELGYRVSPQKNYRRTTIPAHYKYPNLIEGMQLMSKNQVWQSDITYFAVGDSFCYLVFIMDVYTRRILGYCASDHMRAEANIVALRMAFKTCGGALDGLIHHSDRGSQYIDSKYTGLLLGKGIKISMGLIAQENAYAERINGIIKNEYLTYFNISSLAQLKHRVKRAVKNYNKSRIHRELPSRLSPDSFDKKLLDLYGQKRPKIIIYADGNKTVKQASSQLDFSSDQEPRAPNCPIENNMIV